MVLDKASCDLLQYLMDQETSKTIMAISKDLKESRRKIYYHIDKINAALVDEALHIISIPRIGIHLTEEQRDACCKLLSEVDSYDYIMSAHERMMIMLLWIGISKERITIEKLIELTEVSRNTVLNDLNSIRYQLTLEQYQVTLQVSKSQGYHLHAHPLNKIQYLQSLLYHIFMEENATFVSILEDKMKERLDDECLLSVEMNQFFDDIAYLTIHIGGFLKYTPSSQKNMKKVYLVCDEGVAVSRLLLKQCKLYFPNEQIDTVFTTEQFKSVEDIAQVDVVITTNDDLDSRFPILRVNPILEAEDILKMLDYLKHNIFRNKSKSFSENLSSLISSYIVDSKLASKFQEEVQTLINKEIVVQAFLEDI
ncbi:TPA: hypothetical protein V0680_001606 [Streptococcus pneumoniae]|nr:hypothetical protein [Streptococcus pneumoniae]HEW7534255.1 hypothetical protein [Streptococcus pneumoniae]